MEKNKYFEHLAIVRQLNPGQLVSIGYDELGEFGMTFLVNVKKVYCWGFVDTYGNRYKTELIKSIIIES